MFILGAGAFAQSQLQLDRSTSKLSILGTSTLHDWEIKVNDFNGSLEESSGDIQRGSLTAKVKSFKSFKKSMDNVVFEALEEKQHPTLTFQYGKTIRSFTEAGKSFRVISGKLTIAGTTRDMELTMKVSKNGDGIGLTGTKSFKMSDFNIKPPTAVFGTIKSGDDVTIDFNINFS